MRGLAKGSADQSSTFEFLVGLMQKQELEHIQPILFGGFIHAVHAEKPGLARHLQERVLEVPELKPHFVYLLGATPIVPWGAKKLLELARTGELEAWRFEHISYGRKHETISDSDLVEILSALNKLEGGVFSTLEILRMRFLTDKDSDYMPNEALRSVGRETILKLLSMYRDEINWNRLDWIDQVADKCLSDSAPDNEIGEIVGLLCEGIESSRLHSFKLEKIIAALVENFPEVVLNRVFTGDAKEQLLVHSLFRDSTFRSESLLNLVPMNRLIRWCNGNQDRIQKIATAVSSYSCVDKEKSPLDNPKQVILSSHIKALLEVAENKIGIVETIFDSVWPDVGSGSPAEILEVRSKAFAELLNHHSPEVREFAKIKLTLIEKAVQKNREQEAEENSWREQRFE